MNKALNKYKDEILSIAAAYNDGNGTDPVCGAKMFIANLRNVGKPDAHHYPGADHLDWNAVSAEIGPISDTAEADMVNTFAKYCRGEADE